MRMQKTKTTKGWPTRQEFSRCSEFVNVFCFPDASAPRNHGVYKKKPSVPQFQSQHRHDFRNNFSRATEGVLVDAASNQWPQGESQVQQATLHAIDSSLAAYKSRLKPGTSETLIQ